MSIKRRVFAAMYDRMTAATEEAGLRDQRRGLLAQARGSVLEIGGGTGANLPLYDEAVTSLTVTEPEEPMACRLDRRAKEQDRPVEVVRAAAENLPFEDGSFDCVVSTLVLCTVEGSRVPLERRSACSSPRGNCCSSSTCARRRRVSHAGRIASTG